MKIAILTLGCKVNEYESSVMKEMLESAGHNVYTQCVMADAYIINSCAITSMAEKKSRQMISKVRAVNENALIYICGCAAENNAEQFDNNGVQRVFGVTNKTKIVDIIEGNDTLIVDKQTYEVHPSIRPSKNRVNIKIQDGCDNYCSYCIIPYLRGPSRSRPLPDVIDEIMNTTADEITITGIDTASYMHDGKPALVEVVKALNKSGKRYRFSSIEINIIDHAFLELLKNSPNFCRHFHLPLQAGCDNTLRRMNRKYTTEEFAKKVSVIRQMFGDDVSISTDLIVGFVGETDADYDRSYKFVRNNRFSFVHIFKYSKRKGTAAYNMRGDVNPTVINERMSKMQELNDTLKSDYALSMIGKIVEVLAEKYVSGKAYGYSQNYIRCVIDSYDNNRQDKIIQCRVLSYENDMLICEYISNKEVK